MEMMIQTFLVALVVVPQRFRSVSPTHIHPAYGAASLFSNDVCLSYSLPQSLPT